MGADARPVGPPAAVGVPGGRPRAAVAGRHRPRRPPAVGAARPRPPGRRPVEPPTRFAPQVVRMSLAIRGLGTAHPPAPLTPDDGLRLARVLAGPDVRTSTWLGPVYANSGNRRRFQVVGGQVIRDVLAGTRDSGSPFLPSAENDGIGP